MLIKGLECSNGPQTLYTGKATPDLLNPLNYISRWAPQWAGYGSYLFIYFFYMEDLEKNCIMILGVFMGKYALNLKMTIEHQKYNAYMLLVSEQFH